MLRCAVVPYNLMENLTPFTPLKILRTIGKFWNIPSFLNSLIVILGIITPFVNTVVLLL